MKLNGKNFSIVGSPDTISSSMPNEGASFRGGISTSNNTPVTREVEGSTISSVQLELEPVAVAARVEALAGASLDETFVSLDSASRSFLFWFV